MEVHQGMAEGSGRLDMNRRHAIKMITGAFVGQLLLGDGTALSAESAGRHWIRVVETPWLLHQGDYAQIKHIRGERSDLPGAWFCITIPKFHSASYAEEAIDMENARQTLDTYLDPRCVCSLSLGLCLYHRELFKLAASSHA